MAAAHGEADFSPGDSGVLQRRARGIRTHGQRGLAGEPANPAEALLQQEYLFSRIVIVDGGSQQMQLITVAKHILGLSHG